MKWTRRQSKSIEGTSIVAHLVTKDRAVGVIIEKDTPDGPWRGIALFPPANPDRLQHAVALARYENLETESDVEDLLREQGDPEGDTLVEFIEIEAAVSEGGLAEADDLPYLVPVERLAQKAKKTVKKTPKTEKIVPYSRRNYPRPDDAEPDSVKLLPLNAYNNIIVSFSGGKDSVACVLYLLELGVDPKRIELWHQAVDGKPGRDERFWDWPCTEGYCEAFAKAFGMKLLFQWKDGGYLGELTRRNTPTASTTFQLLDGKELTTGGEGQPGTRLAFPAMSADLRTRWCSAYVKIDVAKKVFSNDPRFSAPQRGMRARRTLMLTGERREESGNRARYANTADYASTQTRTVHQWRAVLGWFERDVWEIMEKFRVRPHPAYSLGWSRVSCLPCIFGNRDQWASVKEVTPEVFRRMVKLEDKFHSAARQLPEHSWSEENQKSRYLAKGSSSAFQLKSFDGYLRSGESLDDAAKNGNSYITSDMREHVKLAKNEHYDLDVILGPDEEWTTPVGAYKGSGGPT